MSNNIKPGLTVFTVLLSICMLLPATVLSTQINDEDIMAGEGTFRIAMQDDIKATNPLTVSDVWSWNVLRWVYEDPMYTNPEIDVLTPYIAVGSANLSTTIGAGNVDWADCDIGNFNYAPKSTWSGSGNIGEAIIFYDFTNVTWHDDVQMTIRDILFSFHVAAQVPGWTSSMNCLKDNGGGPGSNYSTTSWLHIYKVWESADNKQAALKFVLQEPYGDFFTDTLSVLLLPYHIWGYTISGQNTDGAKIWCDLGYNLASIDSWKIAAAQSYQNEPPIGSGPFEWNTWQKGQYSLIDTWPDHFFRTGYKYEDYSLDSKGESFARQPNIDAMQFRIYKTAEAAVLALKSNDIDYIAWPVPPTFVQELGAEPDIALQFSPDPSFYYMAYNMRRTSFGYKDGDPLKEDVAKPLRLAISHCIDKERIVDRLLLGFGVEGDGPVSPLSDWYNDSLSQYSFNPTGAMNILDDAGYFDFNADGWRENPDGTPIGSSAGGLIEIMTPEANYDPIRAQAGLMIAQQLQVIGINAQSIAMDFGSIVDRIEQRDFDMYILGWDIQGQPASYLHEFFHSSRTVEGQNYPGYQNMSLFAALMGYPNNYDDIIDQAIMTNDPAERLQHVKDAQGSISSDLPYDVLYYRTNIEAYRSANYVGWEVDEFGTVFNWETVQNIRKPVSPRLTATFLAPPSTMASNSTNSISLWVKAPDGLPVEGATVKLNCTSGSLTPKIGNTLSTGKFTTIFTAPYVPPTPDNIANGIKVVIEMEEATKNGYDPASPKCAFITIYPEGEPFLSVAMSADPDVIDPDVSQDGLSHGFTYVETIVKDQNGDPVPGVAVSLSVSPDLLAIAPPSALTDADGKATFTVTSPDLPDDDGLTHEFTIRAIANLTGYKNGLAFFTLLVVDKDYSAPSPVTSTTSVTATNVLNTSATIKWTTDQPSDSTVNYSTNPTLLSNISIHNSISATSHQVKLTGLTPDTKYYFEVNSADSFGNWISSDNASNYYSFTTLLVNPVIPVGDWSTPIEIGSPVLYCADAYEKNLMAYSRSDSSTHSNDYGETWSSMSDFSGRVEMYEEMVYRVNQSGSSILFSKSSNFGETWTPTVNIFDLVGSNDGVYGINYYESTLFAYSHDTNSGNYTIKLSKSADDGATWSTPVIVDYGLSMSDPGANEIAYANGKLYMTYFDVILESEIDIVVIESADMGNTWGNRKTISQVGFYPVIQADGDALHLTYIGISDDATSLALKYANCLNGEDWSTPKDIGDMTDGDDPMGHHTLVADSGRIFAGYLDYHNNDPFTDEYNLHISKSLNNGVTWEDMGDVTGSDNNAMYPSLLISGGRLHFIWADFGNSSWSSWDDAVTMYRYLELDAIDQGGSAINTTSLPKAISCAPEGSGAPVNSIISITFDGPMNKSSVQQAFSVTPTVAGSFSWNLDGTQMSFTPSSNLSKNSTYQITINGSIAKDLNNKTLDGNKNGILDAAPNDDFSWTFNTWLDHDDDGIPDSADLDDDNDGTPDTSDDFPLDASEDTDTDNDDIGNNADEDDDNDGFLDEWEEVLDTDPLDDADSPLDTDDDGIPDGNANNSEPWMDIDDDEDGALDSEDAFPLDSTEDTDTDNDGTGNNADPDDDDDDVADTDDAFPLDLAESVDTDGDGMGNNADTDDDDDGVLDTEDFDPLDPNVSADPNTGGFNPMIMAVIAIIVVAAVLGSVLFLRKRPSIGPKATEETPKPPETTETSAPKTGLTNQEMVERIEKAYKEGKMTEEQYLMNLEKFK